MIQGASDGRRDLSFDEVSVEVVEMEVEVRESGGNGAREFSSVSVRGDKMEHDVFRTSGVVENGEDSSDGAPEVSSV